MARFYIENYGCQMNLSEADSLLLYLSEIGHRKVNAPAEADVVIINTCSVRRTAEDRIVGRLGFFRNLNNHSEHPIHVILMGCMAQNVGMELKKDFPDVLKLVWGTYNKEGIAHYLTELEGIKDSLELKDYNFMDAMPMSKFPFKSLLPISHGCDNFCSYCIVPVVRGRETHRKSADILDNAKRLVDSGVLDITLLGQNVNSYEDGSVRFPELMDKIANHSGVKRLTFLTSHPKDFSKELAAVISTTGNVIKQVHLPLQAANNRLLKLMNRKYTLEQYLEKIAWLKQIPLLTISTDLIVGFPTETDAEYMDTLLTIRQVRYLEAFTYHYNTRPGTPAERLEGQVPEAVKKERLSILIAEQNHIKEEVLTTFVGLTMPVLIESVSRKNKSELIGSTNNGIKVFIESDKNNIGNIMKVHLTAVSGTGLKGVFTD